MTTQKKILFIDRDGTLIKEPSDLQIDRVEKLDFTSGVIPSLLQFKDAGYSFVMISNQDGLGTPSLPTDDFTVPHELMLRIFSSQGIHFEAVRICPHLPIEGCNCRKPKVGLILDYLIEQKIDRENSYVIGDRETDIQFSENIGIKGIRIDQKDRGAWAELTNSILLKSRTTRISRKTNETSISVEINLDCKDDIKINTGIGFFNHMLEQLAKHAGFSLTLLVNGDLHIDDHHTVEDTAIVLAEAIRQALGDKMGIGRYGFLLPMDESLAQVAIDLSGRSYFVFNGKFNREQVGDLSTELVPHFFRSFAEGLKATLHIDVKGENNHHMIESVFKGVGRTLRQAIQKIDVSLPSTKGVL
ncbi:MAG TPA: bifunctional histidinol-phosphatase/imidazoleglycerol-phosphate dehydratase HisB [Gammaproteobacteria bacterium]|nr:bifunctional histidinol-phosphatase/imidazoleglycerol-phosphate dehydratase HisB [Gammaproteobacteria bacterium]